MTPGFLDGASGWMLIPFTEMDKNQDSVGGQGSGRNNHDVYSVYVQFGRTVRYPGIR